MKEITIKYSNIGKITLTSLVFFSYFFFLYLYNINYPDWESYKFIYEDISSEHHGVSNDFLFIVLVKLGNYFNLTYWNFRFLIHILIILLLIPIQNRLNSRDYLLLILINLIFFFFQIRQCLAVELIYLAFLSKSRINIFFKDLLALFFHFSSSALIFGFQLFVRYYLVFVSFLLILITFISFQNIISYFNIVIEKIEFNYSHQLIESSLQEKYSEYFLISPVLYILLVFRVNAKTGMKVFVALLLFFLIFNSFFISFLIPTVFVNGFYRLVVVYLSYCILNGYLKGNFINYFICLVLLFKDLYSSQL
jgi:hypothetical protein